MDEKYLALRWNNHNTIFTKILNLLREQEAYTDVSLACGGKLYSAHKFVLSTCSEYFKEMFTKTPCKHPVVFMKDVTVKDLESLLDFMYKGEVHVPQSDLGSLLRTAEALQVKGLAVPDDAPRVALPVPSALTASHTHNMSHATPSVPQFTPILPRTSVASPILQAKRKRVSETPKKDEPPRLVLRPDISLPSVTTSGKKTKAKTWMPELKRFKTDSANKDVRNGEKDESDEAPPTDTPSPAPSSLIGDEAVAQLKRKIKLEDQNQSRTDETNAVNEEEGEEATGEEDEEEEEERGTEGDEGGEKSSPPNPSEADDNFEQSNSSLPNSEISTAELLQVDLSEDGTQFIIAPGGDGSRPSSAAGEEQVVNEGPKKPFVCPLCGHTFTRRDNLANHLKTHTGDRPFMCQYCHKCFSRKDYLKQHERIHTGEKPYACEICGRAFTRKEGLTDHMRCHSDFKEFECETCGKSFKQKCGLRFHKRNYRH